MHHTVSTQNRAKKESEANCAGALTCAMAVRLPCLVCCAASSISFANTFGVLFTVVFYDLVVVPLTNKIGRPISMTFRCGSRP
jgi:hypothetical protein